MKTSSIIFIFVGIICIILGLLFCKTADAQARADGFNLHEGLYDADGNIKKNFSFSLEDEVNVSKIAINLEGVEVEIIGGASKSEIICENLATGTYACTVSNKVISITNVLDSSTILDALGSIRFEGIRNFFDPNLLTKKDSKIYIYINEDSETIKQIAFELDNCDVKVQNVVGSLDIRLKAEDSNIIFSDCSTDSSVNCDVKNSNIDFINFEFNRSEFTLEESTYKFESTLVLLYRFDIVSNKEINVNSETYTEYFLLNNEFESYPLVKINGVNSEIDINYLS